MSLRVVGGAQGVWSPGISRPGAGTMGSEVRSRVLGSGCCASTATAPLWGRSEVGEGGFLLLELRQVRGELDNQ